MKILLDTSVLIGGGWSSIPGAEPAISAVSLSELHFGLLIAPDAATRALRANRLGVIEARFPDPLALDDRVARVWGELQAAVAERGGNPRKRMADLAIAATAKVHNALLITADVKDLKIVEDLVDFGKPSA
ncbi:MAG TPA: PIN domain-containing protein [Solirubrobacterales bacterium]|nr:PIN domain-containing protein [Solirubrobacterales bacterium]